LKSKKIPLSQTKFRETVQFAWLLSDVCSFQLFVMLPVTVLTALGHVFGLNNLAREDLELQLLGPVLSIWSLGIAVGAEHHCECIDVTSNLQAVTVNCLPAPARVASEL
jgi:hypothetical protein